MKPRHREAGADPERLRHALYEAARAVPLWGAGGVGRKTLEQYRDDVLRTLRSHPLGADNSVAFGTWRSACRSDADSAHEACAGIRGQINRDG